MIVVDSSVWIDYLNEVSTPQTKRLDAVLGLGQILMGDLILCEVLQGLRSEREVSDVRQRFGAFRCAAMVGEEVALDAALHYRLLRRRGITIRRTVDLLIGTYCLRHHHQLLHNDRDFMPMVEHLGLVEA